MHAECPFFSADGRRLYFGSRQKGTFGYLDIWMSKKQGKAWSRPVNLGPDINNRGDDVPGFVLDGDVIYYDKCCPWAVFATGKADSESAIRHMADIFAHGKAKKP